tara:strand:- start:156 stop:734 length:579 start_codon:yes stop_codon:yes gene_type:complete
MKFQTKILPRLIVLFVVGLMGISCIDAETTKEERVGDFVLHVPGDWKKEQPSSRMRALQFGVPASDGDQSPAELAVFNFKGGGSVDQNIKRWIDQFDAKGRKQELFEGKTASGSYWIADISGTYNKSIGPPILRKTQSEPGSRVLAMIVTGKQGVLYLKLAGPEKTVAAQAAQMRTIVGADLKAEKPYVIGS